VEQACSSDVSLTVYLAQGVLFWLGEVDQEQSVSLMQSLYRSAEDDDWKARLVVYLAETQNDQVMTFLDEVLQKEKSLRVRREAVQALAGYENQRALDILLRTVREDSSEAVQREAVGMIGRLELPAAETAMIDLAEAGPSPSVRREAIYRLRERRSPAVVKCFGDIIDSQNQPQENQRAALEGLAGTDSPEALDKLIATARKHADPRTRHEAIDRLRDRDSLTVVNALATIVNEDQTESVQRRALETLADMESQEALSVLIRIAQTHASPGMREEAISRLPDRASPEVLNCLLGIIRDPKESERIQMRALETLADTDEEKTLDALMQIARTHVRPSMRCEAIDGLRRFDEYGDSSPAVVNCLLSIINKKDESEEIRREALDRLADYGTKETWDAVMQIARGHGDLRVREGAIDKLGDIDEWTLDLSPDAAACLAGILNGRNEPERIQRKTLEVLAQDSDEKTRAILIQTATAHANPRLREEAIDRLGDTEDLDAGALPLTITALESIIDNPKESEAIQQRALETLKEIEDPGILTYLKKAAQSHPNRNLRRAAQEIVAEEMAESWNQER